MDFRKKLIPAILSVMFFCFSLCLTNARAATKVELQDAFKSKMHYVSEIFETEPGQWGLRGDPKLWDALKKEFDDEKLLFGVELPPRKFEDLLEDKICKLCKIEYKDFLEKDEIYVKDCDGHDGMSSGFVSLKWWRDDGVKNLSDRYGIMVLLTDPHAYDKGNRELYIHCAQKLLFCE